MTVNDRKISKPYIPQKQTRLFWPQPCTDFNEPSARGECVLTFSYEISHCAFFSIDSGCSCCNLERARSRESVPCSAQTLLNLQMIIASSSKWVRQVC